MNTKEMRDFVKTIRWDEVLLREPTYDQLSYRRKQDRTAYQVGAMLGKLKSAEQAGFFAVAGNRSRMIAPTGVVHTANGKLEASPSKIESENPPERPKSTPTGGGSEGPSGVHPALIAMLRELPRPGTEWAQSGRVRSGFRD